MVLKVTCKGNVYCVCSCVRAHVCACICVHTQRENRYSLNVLLCVCSFKMFKEYLKRGGGGTFLTLEISGLIFLGFFFLEKSLENWKT